MCCPGCRACLLQLRKKFRRGPAGGGAQFVERATLDLGDGFGDFLHVGRFAALAAIRHGGEIGAVGLQHEPVGRRGGDGVANVLSVLEGRDAGEADQRTDLQTRRMRSAFSPKQ